jgi:hypothetical protein
MKQPYLKLWHCLALCGFLLLSTIIYSCKKDNNASWQTGQTLSQTDLTRFKEIYNSGISQTVPYATRETQPGSAVLNLIKNINVQWDSYTITERPDSATVTEFAMQPDSSTFMTRQVSKGQLITDYNKTSAVFVQKNDSVCLGFFMKVIEHVSTAQKKPLLKEVRYKQIPAGFNGQVMFYGLDRRYLTGYDYQNGTLTGVISISAKQGGSVGVLSVDDTKKVMQTQVCITYPVYEARCGVNYTLGSDGSHNNVEYWCDGSVYVGSVTACTTIDGNGGVPGDGGGGGSGPGTTPPSNDCPPVAVSSIHSGKKVWKYNGPCDPVPPVVEEPDGIGETDGEQDPDFPSNCASWAYQESINSDYQVCGVTGLRFDFITEWQSGSTLHANYWMGLFTKTVYFEFPATRADGSRIPASEAARLTAAAKDAAEEILESQVESSPPPSTDLQTQLMINRFFNILKSRVEAFGGRVTYRNNYGATSIRPYTKVLGGGGC